MAHLSVFDTKDNRPLILVDYIVKGTNTISICYDENGNFHEVPLNHLIVRHRDNNVVSLVRKDKQ